MIHFGSPATLEIASTGAIPRRMSVSAGVEPRVPPTREHDDDVGVRRRLVDSPGGHTKSTATATSQSGDEEAERGDETPKHEATVPSRP